MNRKVFNCLLTGMALLLTLVLAAGICLLPPQYDRTFTAALTDKLALLQTTPSPRIVLLGGSAAAFGVDSAAMEDALPGYHVVNLGLYAALGTRVLLDLSLPLLESGDLVVLLPEQDRQTLSGYFGADTYLQAADADLSLLTRLPADLWPRLLSAWPEAALAKWVNLLTAQSVDPEGVYTRAAFNAHGDVDSPLCACNILPGGVDPTTPIRFDMVLWDAAFLERCNAYARAAAEVGASVCYHFPPMNLAAVASADAQSIDAYAYALMTALHFPVIGSPHDALLDAGWFYDTNFHLNSAGKQLFTRQLVKDVKALLGISTPTTIALPQLPQMAVQTDYSGDDSDAACFTYILRDGEAILTGLTEAGLTRTALTLPTSIEGCPVRSLNAGVLTGAMQLTSVTLQMNIRSIADAAFARCPALTQIHLQADSPTHTKVGQALLSGTEAVLMVPYEALGAYRADYSFAIYASRIVAAP